MLKQIALICFLSLVMLMSILGNLLVMVAVCKDRQLRKIKTNYFIVSLAFADLLVSVLVMPFGAIELVHQHWIYGETFCLVRTSLDVLLTTASIMHLCCIALDRTRTRPLPGEEARGAVLTPRPESGQTR
ncbi:5-hydroxytryptamine receptor 4 [Liparis tanakae]|uniref:5-hydroxytryptamine receptor 4 n=1 Tax=Liparis tanakae TaxID=230148 RepID=A0A4Z2GK98_9TELE|nr:5-hydroxytryptamine receptor 4 [Liparis tanakae]